jgi:hypothetical protein
VVQIGRFKKFLEMIFGWLGLVLEVVFGSRYARLVGVGGSLVAATFAGYYGDEMGLPLLPLLATLTAFIGALDGGLGRCGSATISGHYRVA